MIRFSILYFMHALRIIFCFQQSKLQILYKQHTLELKIKRDLFNVHLAYSINFILTQSLFLAFPHPFSISKIAYHMLILLWQQQYNLFVTFMTSITTLILFLTTHYQEEIQNGLIYLTLHIQWCQYLTMVYFKQIFKIFYLSSYVSKT
ncbi:transmembrane protein, putative (macronuclear) [Tetrahymena thermophila SB210]|uniref:Transmembrane protein, putative n=1 Tax=Tetrahymena thermophila (strain SB210) TaxID=312017 RepID=W7X432_TETTS|nr:transmembrane protein, putative [Tetrahymena thermophila SB210]EWS72192.1 transmembrane protein, putative [Tetrahymena thermophila SB210]|eukprot:XP_012655285.1 transmembrane protein, putative [Tetrahymena thermophila SB210]